jgi:hypothetical protein
MWRHLQRGKDSRYDRQACTSLCFWAISPPQQFPQWTDTVIPKSRGLSPQEESGFFIVETHSGTVFSGESGDSLDRWMQLFANQRCQIRLAKALERRLGRNDP